MKRISLWWQNLKGSILLDLLLLFVVSVSIFTLTNAWGAYRYLDLANEKVNAALQSDSALYYMDFSDTIPPASEEEMEQIIAANQSRYDLVQSVREMPGVRTVLGSYPMRVGEFNSPSHDLDGLTAMIAIPGFEELFPSLNRGAWFDRPQNEDGTYNAVVCGEMFYNIPIGSTLDMSMFYQEGTENIENIFTIRICGVIDSPAFVPTLGSQGTTLVTANFYQDVPAIVLGECEGLTSLMEKGLEFQYGSVLKNFFVDFTADATPEQMQAVKDRLSQTGGCLTWSEVQQGSAKYLDSSFKGALVIPIFYVVIAFVAFFSITILSVFRRTRTYGVYYLLGYSKRRIVWSVTSHTGILILLAAGINLIYVNSYYAWVAMDWIQPDPVSPPYFDAASSWLVVGIAFFMFAVTLAAAIGVLRKKSPSGFWLSSKE